MKKFYLIALVGMLGTANLIAQIPVKKLEGNIPYEANKVYKNKIAYEDYLNLHPEKSSTIRSTPPNDTTFTWISYEAAAMANYEEQNIQGMIMWPDSLVVLTDGGNGTFNWYIHGYAQVFDPVSTFIEDYYGLGITEYNDFIVDSLGINYLYDRTKDTTLIIDTTLGNPKKYYSFTVDGDTITTVKSGSKTESYTYTQSSANTFYSFTVDGDTVPSITGESTTKTYTFTQSGVKTFYSHTIDGDTVKNIVLSIDSTYTYKQDTGKIIYDSTLNALISVVTYAYNSSNPDSITSSVWRYPLYSYTFDTLTKANVDTIASTNSDTLILDSTVVAVYDTVTNKSMSIINYDFNGVNPLVITDTVYRWPSKTYTINLSLDTVTTLSANLDTLTLDSSIVTVFDTTTNTPMNITNYDYTGVNPLAITDTVYRWPLKTYTIDINGDTVNTTTASESKLFLDSNIVYSILSIDTTYGPIDTLNVFIIPYSDLDYTATGPYWFGQDPTFGAVNYDVAKDQPKGTKIEKIQILLDHSHNTAGNLGYITTPIKKRLVNKGEQVGVAFQYKSGVPYKLGDTLINQNTNPFSLTHLNEFELLTYEEIKGESMIFWEDDKPYSSSMHTRNESHQLLSECIYDTASSWYGLYITTFYYNAVGFAEFADEHAVLDWHTAPTGAFFDYAVNGCVVEFNASSNTGADSWKWAFGDGGSSLTQNPTYTYPSKKTTYEVCATGTNSSTGKKYVICKNIEVGFCTGIEDIDISNMVTIHPNPTNGIINIEFGLDAVENIKTEVYNLIGEKIVETLYENVSISKNQLDLSQNPAGVYFIKLSTGDRSTVKKVTLVK